jgi:shikimate kinase
MKSSAICHGAATIVAAFATGKGAAYGISLRNTAQVELTADQTLTSKADGVTLEDDILAASCVKRTLQKYGMAYSGANVETESEIPQMKGLKSSSVAANAIVLATVGAIAKEHGEIANIRLSKTESAQKILINGVEVKDEDILNLGIEAAFDAQVTITGALDDASAAYYGGYAVTDNLQRRIIHRGGMEETLKAVIHLPEGEVPSGKINPETIKPYGKEINLIWDAARKGSIYSAINLNGFIHSACFKQSLESQKLAIQNGAIAAGVSGTGPAVVALTRGEPKDIISAWESLGGRIIQTRPNNRKAQIIR